MVISLFSLTSADPTGQLLPSAAGFLTTPTSQNRLYFVDSGCAEGQEGTHRDPATGQQGFSSAVSLSLRTAREMNLVLGISASFQDDLLPQAVTLQLPLVRADEPPLLLDEARHTQWKGDFPRRGDTGERHGG